MIFTKVEIVTDGTLLAVRKKTWFFGWTYTFKCLQCFEDPKNIEFPYINELIGWRSRNDHPKCWTAKRKVAEDALAFVTQSIPKHKKNITPVGESLEYLLKD